MRTRRGARRGLHPARLADVPRVAKLAMYGGAALALGATVGVLSSPGANRICDHVFERSRAGGTEPSEVGVEYEQCVDAMQRRRARMGLIRRAYYGWCVVMEDTLDEIGRC